MTRSVRIGLRLWGIAEEPFWPAAERLLDLAHLGFLQVADLGREALEPGAGERDRAVSSAWRSRGITWVATASSSSPSFSITRASTAGGTEA